MKIDSNDNEHELLKMVATGSREAFEVIYKMHFIAVYHFAKRFVSDTQIAEDITSESFLKLWERFNHFNSLHGIKSFLFTSAKNACINQNRSYQRVQAREQEFAYLSSTENVDPFDAEIKAKVYQHIYNEIEKLPEQEKKVFKMAYLQGMNNEEIAEKLGINNQSVRNYKARALKKLRLIFKDKVVYAYFLILIWASKFSS